MSVTNCNRKLTIFDLRSSIVLTISNAADPVWALRFIANKKQLNWYLRTIKKKIHNIQNSGDPKQMPRFAEADLIMHCLQMGLEPSKRNFCTDLK